MSIDEDREAELEEGRMPLLDHLIELRNRLMWSVATPTCVAPDSSSISTDPNTPRVAPLFGSLLFGAKWYRNNSYVPSTRCTSTSRF